MGQGAVRSQMDMRICFRVRERKDVDLILGQGMLAAGWHAHTLNAPGKFLVSAPEHDTPAEPAPTCSPTRPSPKPPPGTPASGPELDDDLAAGHPDRAQATPKMIRPGEPTRRAAPPARTRAATETTAG